MKLRELRDGLTSIMETQLQQATAALTLSRLGWRTSASVADDIEALAEAYWRKAVEAARLQQALRHATEAHGCSSPDHPLSVHVPGGNPPSGATVPPEPHTAIQSPHIQKENP